MSQLPRGWEWSTIGEVAEPPQYGWTTRASEKGDIRFLRTTDITRGPIRWDSVPFCSAPPDDVTRFQLAIRDIVVSRAGSVGASALIVEEPPPAAFASYLIRFRPSPSIDERFLAHFLSAPPYWDQIADSSAGIALQNVNARKLAAIKLPVAPLQEQERIVAAIEEAFSKLDAGEAGLRTVRQLLKRMRDAILTAAVTGRLVPQDPTDTPATQLLADLGVPSVEGADLPPLPHSWCWAQVQDVGQVDLGRQRSPKYHTGDNMKPYLRVANVFEDRIDTSDVMEMHFEPEAFERSRLITGDILLNEGQTPELLGRPAMYRGDPPEVAFTNSLLRFRAAPGIEPEWALLVFRNHMHSGRFTRESRITTNIAHLSAARFKPVEFPVPPVEEQLRIVHEFARQSSFIDACERAVDAGLARSAALRRSVLKAAFEGRLVPQDPSDEPASVLLERIRAERAVAPGQQGKRRKKAEAS